MHSFTAKISLLFSISSFSYDGISIALKHVWATGKQLVEALVLLIVIGILLLTYSTNPFIGT